MFSHWLVRSRELRLFVWPCAALRPRSMVEEVRLHREGPARVADTLRHQGDTAPVKRLELLLALQLELLLVLPFSYSIVITLPTKHRPMLPAALSPYRTASI